MRVSIQFEAIAMPTTLPERSVPSSEKDISFCFLANMTLFLVLAALVSVLVLNPAIAYPTEALSYFP